MWKNPGYKNTIPEFATIRNLNNKIMLNDLKPLKAYKFLQKLKWNKMIREF